MEGSAPELLFLLVTKEKYYTELMKKHLFAVFAHPDDEAFGPAGTLLMETEAGTELHLVLLTSGEQGNNPDNHPDLAALRLKEWQHSGELLGASSQTYFGYSDGQLSNADMQAITERLIEHVKTNAVDADEIEMISFSLNGLTGHIDHIVAARATALTFCRLKNTDERLARLRLFCLPNHIQPKRNTSWLYSEPGIDKKAIDEIIDARHLLPQIKAVIDAHASQKDDAVYVKEQLGSELGVNWFQVID